MRVNIEDYDSKLEDSIEINDYDIWNLDTTLSIIIGASLIKFKENLLKSEFKSAPRCLTHNDDDEPNFQEWLNILDSMIYSFTEIAKDNPNSPKLELPHNTINFETFDNIKVTEEQREENRLYWKNWEILNKVYEDKIQDGLNNFAKYFKNLWD